MFFRFLLFPYLMYGLGLKNAFRQSYRALNMAKTSELMQTAQIRNVTEKILTMDMNPTQKIAFESIKNLNPSQRKAVLSPPTSISKCIAGPGSGKTRVLTTRILYLMSIGEPSNSIMAITFTKKAADEMAERLAKLLGIESMEVKNKLTVGTFHSICSRILREFGYYLSNLTSNPNVNHGFTIYDEADALKIVKNILDDHTKLSNPQLNDKQNIISLYDVSNQIQKMKERVDSRLTKVENPLVSMNNIPPRTRYELAQAFLVEYNKRLYDNNALDFNDLLVLTRHLLEEYPHVLSELQRRFRHILVDEFQDTNHQQLEIVRLLSQQKQQQPQHNLPIKTDNNNNGGVAPPSIPPSSSMKTTTTTAAAGINYKRSLFVTGDKHQSIYSWRGAVPENMDTLSDYYPELTVYSLKENYRSTLPITDVANAIIGDRVTIPIALTLSQTQSTPSNQDMIPKSSVDGRKAAVLEAKKKSPVSLVEVADDEAQATFITGLVRRIDPKDRDVAILYRTNGQSKALQDALVEANIPHQVVSGQSVYDSKEVRVLAAYLRMLVNHRDEAALDIAINTPTRGIGAKTLESFLSWVKIELPLESLTVEGSLCKEYLKVHYNITNIQADQQQQGVAAGNILLHLLYLYDIIGEDLEKMLKSKSSKDLLKSLPFTTREIKPIHSFAQLIISLYLSSFTHSTYEILSQIISMTEFDDYLMKLAEDPLQLEVKRAKVNAFLSNAGAFNKTPARVDNSLLLFLDNLQLLQSDLEGKSGGKGVALMTIHAAKGLEFDTVFVTGVEDTYIPFVTSHSGENITEIQRNVAEEKRLLFVAVTRAKKNLFITFRRSTKKFDATGIKYYNLKSSRFLKPLINSYSSSWNIIKR